MENRLNQARLKTSPAERLAIALRVLGALVVFVLAGLAAWAEPRLNQAGGEPLLWLPGGVALAVFLLWGWRYFPVVLVGVLLANFLAGQKWGMVFFSQGLGGGWRRVWGRGGCGGG